jgi:hypothetical protein
MLELNPRTEAFSSHAFVSFAIAASRVGGKV